MAKGRIVIVDVGSDMPAFLKGLAKGLKETCPVECEEFRNDGKDLCHSDYENCIHYKAFLAKQKNKEESSMKVLSKFVHFSVFFIYFFLIVAFPSLAEKAEFWFCSALMLAGYLLDLYVERGINLKHSI
jgi:hypothetical protein